jgi:hypothetical protein
MRSMGHAVEHFAIPGLAPRAVQEASDRFEEVSADFQATRARYYALKTSRLDDIAAVNRASALCRVDGTAPPQLTAAKIDAAIAKAEQETSVLHEACDLAHTALMEAIEEHQEEWLATLDRVDAEATERIHVALVEVRAAWEDLQTARTAPEWVRSFRVTVGQTQWNGGRGISGGRAIDELEHLVTPEQRLVGYSDADGDGTAEAVFEDVIA